MKNFFYAFLLLVLFSKNLYASNYKCSVYVKKSGAIELSDGPVLFQTDLNLNTSNSTPFVPCVALTTDRNYAGSYALLEDYKITDFDATVCLASSKNSAKLSISSKQSEAVANFKILPVSDQIQTSVMFYRENRVVNVDCQFAE